MLTTKLSAPALMDAANEPGVGFAAGGDGGFILPGFLPAFDAAATFVKVLDLMARSAVRLSSVVAALPRTHIAHETLVTPWEQKGTVMRSLVEHAKDRELVLVDGVKVLHDDGWVLALPDPEEPITHVWAEAGSDTDGATARPGVRATHPSDAALTGNGVADIPQRHVQVSCSVSPRERAGRPPLFGRPRVGEGRG